MPEDAKIAPLPRPYLLKNQIQHYAWGSKDRNAYIPRLLGIKPERGIPYAELWMGTHPKAPSLILDPDRGPVMLSDWIKAAPAERLSQNRSRHFSDMLPYMLKILSSAQPLSIQAHPDKHQAETLHKNNPVHYPDDNDKPEIAIAIDSFDALVGFITTSEYLTVLKHFPALNNLLMGYRATPDLLQDVQRLIQISGQDQTRIQACNQAIYQQIKTAKSRTEIENIFLQMADTYGYADLGLILLHLLQPVHLEAGEAIYLGPGVPHCYLRGNILECMANSDNVVRLGLTPKFCDARALAAILDFSQGQSYRIMPLVQGNIRSYVNPSSAFLPNILTLAEGDEHEVKEQRELVLYLVLEGSIRFRWCHSESNSCYQVFRRGDTFIAPANLESFLITAKSQVTLCFVTLP